MNKLTKSSNKNLNDKLVIQFSFPFLRLNLNIITRNTFILIFTWLQRYADIFKLLFCPPTHQIKGTPQGIFLYKPIIFLERIALFLTNTGRIAMQLVFSRGRTNEGIIYNAKKSKIYTSLLFLSSVSFSTAAEEIRLQAKVNKDFHSHLPLTKMDQASELPQLRHSNLRNQFITKVHKVLKLDTKETNQFSKVSLSLFYIQSMMETIYEPAIKLIVNCIFKNGQKMRYMGEYVNIREALIEEWINVMYELRSPINQLRYTLSRIPDGLELRKRKQILTNANLLQLTETLQTNV